MVKIGILVFLIILYCTDSAEAAPVGAALASIAWIPLITTAAPIVLTGLQMVANVGLARAQSNQQIALAKFNEKQNLANAEAARSAAQAKVENQRRQLRFTQGSQLARLGGMGALAEGSPLGIIGQTAGQGKYDELVTEYEGEVQAIQFQQKAAINRYQADVAQANKGLNMLSAVINPLKDLWGEFDFSQNSSLLTGGSKTTWGKDTSGSKIGTNVDSAGKTRIYAPLSSGLS